jgi:cytochrome d ubiquinol oxidase subunit I
MIDTAAMELSRLQFALTAMYHFLFVPLTLGLSVLLGIMESVYVMTGRTIWRDMTKYWGVLFGINFVMGVATGLTMEFQFGTNWAYYSHYVGDIFGVPLAIEGLMAFFLEASFVGLFFFGWNRMSKIGHLTATWLLALGTNLSALWILVANGWMQHPVGAVFNPRSMRMELSSFYDVLFNPVAQAKFVHTVSAGYVTGSIFVMGVSAWFLLKGRNREFAKRSMTIAASFGLASALSVVVLGDESGYTASQNQKMKIAAMEAMWQTEPAPASFTLFGIPDLAARKTDYAVEIPWVLGLIATRSFNQPVPGIVPLVAENEDRIRSGMQAYGALKQVRAHPDDAGALATLDAHVNDLGYGLLLERYTANVTDATQAQIEQAAWDTVPNVLPIFWSFRFMVAIGFFFIAFFAYAFWLSAKRRLDSRSWFLRLSVLILPLPWISSELGWFVAENGRQPWTIDGILPTFLSASSVTAGTVWLSLAGFVLFYSVLAIVELFLMVKYIRLGPEADLGGSPVPVTYGSSPHSGGQQASAGE